MASTVSPAATSSFTTLPASAAMRGVPATTREAALAMGCPRWRMILSVLFRAAKGGLACGLIFLACQGWLFAMLSGELRGLVLSGDLGLMWGAGLACLVPACLCWLMVARSKAPLRLKGLIFAAMFLLWPACLLVLASMSALASLI